MTTIQVTDDVADRLHARKRRGESYNDVLERMLEDAETPAQPAD